MTDHPILFSAPMVLALLGGRKTMTRRIITPQNFKLLGHDFRFHRPDARSLASAFSGARDFRWIEGAFSWIADPSEMHPHAVFVDCRGRPSFSPGDRLWVREAFSYEALDVDRDGFMPPWYWADGNPTSGDYTKPKPSIHMPRWASRLTLVVTDVRVERLQDISEADAIAEGVEYETADPPFYYVPGIWPHSLTAVGIEEGGGRHAARSFAKLWGHINGPGAWEANPWVAATSFTVHRQNIDQMGAA